MASKTRHSSAGVTVIGLVLRQVAYQPQDEVVVLRHQIEDVRQALRRLLVDVGLNRVTAFAEA